MLFARYCIVAGAVLCLMIACTNMDWRQDVQRFHWSIAGTLPAPANLDPSGTDSFSFATMGDFHYGMGQGATDIHRRAFASIKADTSIQFILGLGDLVNTGREHQYNEFKALLTEYALPPFYAVIGNHDIFFNGWDYFRTAFGRTVYEFHVDNTVFIVLDTANGTMGHEQMNWLEDHLKANADKVVILAMHIPFYTGAHLDLFELDDPEQSYKLIALATKYNVDLVLSGHYHGSRFATLKGIRYIVSGAMNDELDSGVNHYLKVSVNGTSLDVTQVPIP